MALKVFVLVPRQALRVPFDAQEVQQLGASLDRILFKHNVLADDVCDLLLPDSTARGVAGTVLAYRRPEIDLSTK